MEELQLRHNAIQFVIDIAFGVAVILPMAYGAYVGEVLPAAYLSIGCGVGYIIHITQKILLYEELLSEAVKEEVESEVPGRVEEAVEEQVNGHG